jgi:hypothetical protein
VLRSSSPTRMRQPRKASRTNPVERNDDAWAGASAAPRWDVLRPGVSRLRSDVYGAAGGISCRQASAAYGVAAFAAAIDVRALDGRDRRPPRRNVAPERRETDRSTTATGEGRLSAADFADPARQQASLAWAQGIRAGSARPRMRRGSPRGAPPSGRSLAGSVHVAGEAADRTGRDVRGRIDDQVGGAAVGAAEQSGGSRGATAQPAHRDRATGHGRGGGASHHGFEYWFFLARSIRWRSLRTRGTAAVAWSAHRTARCREPERVDGFLARGIGGAVWARPVDATTGDRPNHALSGSIPSTDPLVGGL